MAVKDNNSKLQLYSGSLTCMDLVWLFKAETHRAMCSDPFSGVRVVWCSAGAVHRESQTEAGIVTESECGVSSLSDLLRAFTHTLLSPDLAQQNCSETTNTHLARNPEGAPAIQWI